MGTLDIIIMFIGCIIDTYLLFDFFYNFFQIKEKWGIKEGVFFSCFLCIGMFWVNMCESDIVNLVLIPILVWGYVTVLFEAEFRVRLGCFIVAYLVMIGVEFLLVVISAVTTSMLSKTGLIPLSQYAWLLVLIKFLNYIVFSVLKQMSGKSKKRIPGRLFVAYMCLPIGSVGCMITIFYSGVDFSGSLLQRVVMTLFFVFMLISNIVVFYTFQKYTEGLYKENENQLEIIRQMAEIQRVNQVVEMNENYKEIVHNTSHFLGVIQGMAEENKNEEIYNLVKDIDSSFRSKIVKVYSDYIILNTLLTENESKAKANGIIFDAYVESGTNLDIVSDADMISMYGNLLDNAVTAASKKGPNSLVRVRIFMQNCGSVCVSKIVNDFVGPLMTKNNRLQTTKKEGGLHGLGIKSVERVAEKYNGYLEYYIEDDKFVSVLVLQIVE